MGVTRAGGVGQKTLLLAAPLAAALLGAVTVSAPRLLSQQPGQEPVPQKPPSPAAAAPAPPAPAQPQPGEKPFKNVTVLTDMPPSQMPAVMHLMRAGLGVRCDYCHVLEKWDLEVPAKAASREMLRLVKKINDDNFGGRPVVTCYTCHHGQIHPPHVPPMELALINPIHPSVPPGGPSQEALANLPTATEVLDRYLEALGGRAALEAVESRVSRGTLLRLGIVNGGTPEAYGVNRGQADPLEIIQRLPDKVTLTLGPPAAQVVQTVDGASGMIKSPQGQRPLTPLEVSRQHSRADLRRDLKLRDRAETAQVIGRDHIDGREVLLLRTKEPEGSTVLLAFDTQTGLLRRQTVYTDTVLGPDPEQTDYEDYREVGGVKVPFTIKISYLDDLHFGSTRKMAEVRNNAVE